MAKRKRPIIFDMTFRQYTSDDAPFQFRGEGWYMVVRHPLSMEYKTKFERHYCKTDADLASVLATDDVFDIDLLAFNGSTYEFEDTCYYLHFDPDGNGTPLRCVKARGDFIEFADPEHKHYVRKVTRRNAQGEPIKGRHPKEPFYEQSEPVYEGWSEIHSYDDIWDGLGTIASAEIVTHKSFKVDKNKKGNNTSLGEWSQ